MNVKELKEAIKYLPDNMDVMIEQTNDEGRFGMANEVKVELVKFQDGDSDEIFAELDCVIIRDV